MRVYLDESGAQRLIGGADVPEDCGPVFEAPMLGAATIVERFTAGVRPSPPGVARPPLSRRPPRPLPTPTGTAREPRAGRLRFKGIHGVVRAPSTGLPTPLWTEFSVAPWAGRSGHAPCMAGASDSHASLGRHGGRRRRGGRIPEQDIGHGERGERRTPRQGGGVAAAGRQSIGSAANGRCRRRASSGGILGAVPERARRLRGDRPPLGLWTIGLWRDGSGCCRSLRPRSG